MRCAVFGVSLPAFFITFSVPVQSGELGASAFAIGSLFAVFTAVLVVVRPLVGLALDRHGRRPLLILAAGCHAAANVAFSLADSLVMLYGARALQAVGVATLLLTVDALTSDFTGRRDRARAMGRNLELQTRASLMGATIGFTLIGAMSSAAWQWAFLFFALAAIVSTVFAGLQQEVSRASAPVLEIGPARGSRPPSIRPWWPVFATIGFSTALVPPIFLLYLQHRFDATPPVLALAFLPAGLLFAALPARLAGVIERFGVARSLATGFAASALGYSAMMWADSLPALVVANTFAALGVAVVEPARRVLAADLAAPGRIGLAFGQSEALVAAGAIIGPLAGGLMFDWVSPQAAFGLAGGSMFLAGIYCINIHRYGIPLNDLGVDLK